MGNEEYFILGKKSAERSSNTVIVLSGDEYRFTEPNDDGGIVIEKKESEES